MSKILIAGIATDGPINTVFTSTNIKELNRLFGGHYTESFSVTALGTGVALRYAPQSEVKTTFNGNPFQLFRPSVQNTSFTFGSMGASGFVLGVDYTPYLGQSDLLNQAKFLFENGETSVNVCRMGGVSSSFTTSTGWKYVANYRGVKYNNITLTSTVTSLSISAFDYYPYRLYTGTVDDIVNSVNVDADLGVSPIYISAYTETSPTFTTSLTGGSDGSIDYASFVEFLDSASIPDDISHVVVLGNVDTNIAGALGLYLEDNANQYRMYFLQTPDLTKNLIYGTGLDALSTFSTRNTYAYFDNFEAKTHNTIIASISGCTVSPTGALYFDKTQSGFTSLNTYSGYKAIKMFPSLTSFELDTPSNKRILSLGGYLLGSGLTSINAYIGSLLLATTTCVSGFFGFELSTGADKVTFDSIGNNPTTIVLDDLRLGLVDSFGTNTDLLYSSMKNVQYRHPALCLITGDVELSVGGTTYNCNAVNALPLVLSKNGGLLTNKSNGVRTITPVFNEVELDFASTNGIMSFRNWIGSGVAIDKAVVSDYSISYRLSTKISEIYSLSTPYLRRYLGLSLKTGSQSVIAKDLTTLLSNSIRDITIEDVKVDYIDSNLNVYIQGFVGSEIYSITFNVGAV